MALVRVRPGHSETQRDSQSGVLEREGEPEDAIPASTVDVELSPRGGRRVSENEVVDVLVLHYSIDVLPSV